MISKTSRAPTMWRVFARAAEQGKSARYNFSPQGAYLSEGYRLAVVLAGVNIDRLSDFRY